MRRYKSKRSRSWDDVTGGSLDRFSFSRKKQPAVNHKIHLGKTNKGDPVGYTPLENDTLRMMIVGPSGMGKTRLMDDICRQVITDEERPSLVVIDPKPSQDLYKSVLKFSLDRGLEDRLHFLDPNYNYFPGYNLMELHDKNPDIQAKNMLSARLKAWGEEKNSKPNLETWSEHTDKTLIKAGLTLNESKYLTDTLDNEYRESIISRAGDEQLSREWEKLLAMGLPERDMKLGVVNRRTRSFLSSPAIWTMVSQKENALQLREVFDRGDILLVTLPRRRGLHPDDAQVLGRLLINDIITAAANRSGDVRPVYLVIDEFSRMVSKDVGEILDEGRSSNLNFVFGHQHLAQVREKDLSVFYSELTNTNVQAVFGGLTRDDLEIMADEFSLGDYDPKKVKDEIQRTFYEPEDREVTEETRKSHSGRKSGETTREREDGEEEVVKRESTESGEERSRSSRYVTEHKERSELSSRQFYSLQEQQLLAEQKLRKPSQQWLHVRVNNGKPALIKAPNCNELDLPSERIEQGKEKIVDAKEVYSSREDVKKEVEEREKKLKSGGGEEKEEPEDFVN